LPALIPRAQNAHGDPPTYAIEHTAYTFLLDRKGEFVILFPPGTPADRMVFMLREQLGEAPR